MKIILILSLVLSFKLFAGIEFDDSSSGTAQLSAIDSSFPTFELYKEKDGDEYEVYVPFKKSGQSDDPEKFTMISTRVSSFNTTQALPSVTAGNFANFRLELQVKHNDSGAGDEYIYVAVRSDSSEYEVIQAVQGTSTNLERGVNTIASLEINLDKICGDASVKIDDECSLTLSDGSTEVVDEAEIIIFHSDDGSISENTTVKIGDDEKIETGKFLKINVHFSNRVVSETASTDNHPTISEIEVGDTQLNLTFKNTVSNFSSSDIIKTYVINYNHTTGLDFTNETTPITPFNITDATTRSGTVVLASPFFETETAKSSGDIKINDLENGTEVFLGIILVDKFQFGTVAAPALSETPLEIQVFLKKQNCYLLSAGFRMNHPILQMARKFRDDVLRHYTFGQSFINWYYKSAPKYAVKIYESDFWSNTVKQVAQFITFVLTGNTFSYNASLKAEEK